MTVNIQIPKLLKPLSFAIVLAFLVSGFAASSAFAQDYKEAYNTAIEAAKAKDYQKAYTEFTKAAQLAEQADDKDIADRARKVAAQIDYNTGKQLVASEKFAEGLKRFEQGIKMYPSYSNNYVGKALALKKLERDEDALKAYEELIAYGEKNNDTEAVREGKQAIRDHYVFLASSALGSSAQPGASEARAALAHLEKVKEVVEPDADILYYEATARSILGEYSAAVQLADQALELHRGSKSDAAKIHFLKGEALMYDGNTEAAKEAFRNATFGSYKAPAEHYIETL